MTTLVGVQGTGWCVFGSESRASLDSGRLIEAASPKIVENNGILIAGAGAGRGSNLMHYGWKPARPKANQKLDDWMTTQFIPQMRLMFIESGYDMKEEGEFASHDSEFLIAVNGTIYVIFEDYSWEREQRSFYVAGSGGDYALGALEALNFSKCTDPKSAEKIVKKSIEVAKKFDVYSGGTVKTFIQTKANQKLEK